MKQNTLVIKQGHRKVSSSNLQLPGRAFFPQAVYLSSIIFRADYFSKQCTSALRAFQSPRSTGLNKAGFYPLKSIDGGIVSQNGVGEICEIQFQLYQVLGLK